MAPPWYCGTGGVIRSSLLQPTAARTSPAASDMRRIVIVGLPLERVAERHAEQVRVEVVQAVVQPRRGHLVEDRLASPTAPIVLPDVLIREIGAERRGELHRRADRELVALPLRQLRRHRLGRSCTAVVQIAAAERPFRVPRPLRADPEPARVVVILEQLAV